MDIKSLGKLTLARKEYTGIGSRETSPEAIRLMRILGQIFAKQGLTLRSGGADGADAAFETGCDQETGEKQIFLPWRGFNNNKSTLTKPSMAAEGIASEIHPNWGACKPAARLLHARNVHQVLGSKLQEPSAFVIFYAKVSSGAVQGGTATAVNLAKMHGIPCFNLKDEDTFEAFKTFAEENL